VSQKGIELFLCGLFEGYNISLVPFLVVASNRTKEGCDYGCRAARLCATDEDVVDGNVNQLDNVTDNAHDEETDTDGLADLEEFALVGLSAAVDELSAVLDELAGHLHDLLHLV